MNMSRPSNLTYCDASDRDTEPTGQMPGDTQPLSDSRPSSDAHPDSAPKGTSTDGSDNDAGGRAPRRRASAHASRAVIVRCVHCKAALRWRGRRSGRMRCPRCRRRLILRCRKRGQWTVLPENDDSVAGMICDWLGRRCPDEDSDT
jgi:hypothetical protein